MTLLPGLTVVLAVAVGVLVGLGSRRRGSPALSRTDTPDPLPARLRIATFNVCQGRGIDRRVDLDRTAAQLGELDVVCLQEVRAATWFGGVGQARRLARLAGYPLADYLPAERRFWRDWLGNALLSRIRPAGWRLEPLPNREHKAWRSLVHVRMGAGARGFDLFLLHAARREDRDDHIARALALFECSPRAVLAGDLNCAADHPLLREFVQARCAAIDPLAALPATPLHGAAAVEPRFDHLLVRGLSVVDQGVRPGPASDHPLYWIEVDLDSD